MTQPFGYVYLITNCVTKEKYIGKKKGKFSLKYLGSGDNIKDAVKKYGASNFEIQILTWCYSQEELDRTEQACLLVTNASQKTNYLNITGGKLCDIKYWRGVPRQKVLYTVPYQRTLKKRNLSGYRGVYWNKRAKKWAVRLKHNGVERYGGVFADKELAARKADEIMWEVLGAGAKLNFP